MIHPLICTFTPPYGGLWAGFMLINEFHEFHEFHEKAHLELPKVYIFICIPQKKKKEKKSGIYTALINLEQIFRKDVIYVQIYLQIYKDFTNGTC